MPKINANFFANVPYVISMGVYIAQPSAPQLVPVVHIHERVCEINRRNVIRFTCRNFQTSKARQQERRTVQRNLNGRDLGVATLGFSNEPYIGT